jgi:phytoene dehydrogenase-like protein
VTAALLAAEGLRTLVLERRERVGGAAATAELAPGVRAPALAHTVGRFRTSLVRRLRLRDHGLALVRPDVRAFAPHPDGGAITLWADPARTAAELRRRSSRDADAYVPFDRKVRALASFIAYVQAATPPDLKGPTLADALEGLRLGRALRGLGGRSHVREVLRILPMAVADLVGEVFQADELRGAIAARGVQYTAMGPWSTGTAAVLLGDSAGTDAGAAGQTVFARGGPGTLSEALENAARSLGASIRTATEVVRIVSKAGRATGVALDSGTEIDAPVVVSAVDPKRTLLGLVDPGELGPSLVWRAGNLRLPGVVAKVNLALSGIPTFLGAEGDDSVERLRGRIVMAPGIDALERAFDASKYGEVSESPFMEATIPTLSDDSLAPKGAHVMSVLVQYAPYHRRRGDWDSERESFGDLVLRTLERYAPGITRMITERRILTPLDLEREYGLTEGHPLHGEPGLDQFFAWRPLLGHARYRLPLEGLYLCGSGAHPGGGITGMPGANAAREILADWRRRR